MATAEAAPSKTAAAAAAGSPAKAAATEAAYNSAKESVRGAFLLQKQFKYLNHRKEMACECCDFGRQRMYGTPL